MGASTQRGEVLTRPYSPEKEFFQGQSGMKTFGTTAFLRGRSRVHSCPHRPDCARETLDSGDEVWWSKR